MYDVVIVDTPPSLNDVVLTALDRSALIAVVTILDVPSLRNLTSFLEIMSELEVDEDRLRLVLNKVEDDIGINVGQAQDAFGGRFVVHATDSRGLYVAGTCRVLDASGTDRTSMFVTRIDDRSMNVGNPGEVMAGGPNEFSAILLPGEYLLEFDFPEHGSQRQRVTVKPREVADVRIRLP